MSWCGYSLAPVKVVIDEDIIYDSLVEDFKALVDEDKMQDRKETVKAMAAAEKAARNYDLQELKTLRLSFKDIALIENLDGLSSLTYLSLDNNKIPAIENISHLKNLTWLDMSFNKITSMDGLEALVNLKDLTLFHNSITEITGLDTLTNLHCLSLGKNKIATLAEIGKLRKYTQIKSLALEGNPVSQMDEYRGFTLAHLETLEYLDYVLTDEEEVKEARETFQDELIILTEKESMTKANEDQRLAKLALTDKLVKANMGVVESMYDDMFKSDQEMPKLIILPGIKELMEDYQEKINDAAQVFKDDGTKKYLERVEEEKSFTSALEHERTTAVKRSQVVMQSLIKEKNDLSSEIQMDSDDEGGNEDAYIARVDRLREELDVVVSSLMEIEVERTEAMDKLANVFENHVGDIQKVQLENQNDFFRAVEEAEVAFTESLTELVAALQNEMETAEEGSESENISAEVADLLGDKDALSASIQTSNDTHIAALLGKEDSLRAEEIGMMVRILTEFKENKFKSNRARVLEITDFKREFMEELRELKKMI